ncbi:MAG: hypothetical protein ACOC40_01765 [Thermoplasmatota archaeon]
MINREKIEFYDVRDVIDGLFYKLELGPFDIESVKKMIGDEGNEKKG